MTAEVGASGIRLNAMSRKVCELDRARLIKIERSDLSKWQVPSATRGEAVTRNPPPRMSAKQIEKLIERLGILVVDENQYMRKLTRMMLMNIGAKSIYEAADGLAALDVIRTANPDVVLLDWDLPVLSGPDHAHRALARRVHQAQHPRHHAQRLRGSRARAR